MNAQERRLGLASALTLKSLDNKIRVLDKLESKTAAMAKSLAALTAEGTVLFFIAPSEMTKTQGLENLHGTHTDVVTHASPAEILKYDFCVFTTEALKTLSTHFAS
jgi:ribosomal protein L4